MEETKQKIREFWSANPMTYGSEHGNTVFTLENGTQLSVPSDSEAFFDLADRTFYGWNRAEHNESGNFGRLFDYRKYRGCKVLEVGCGLGCMAMNWAQHGAQVTAVDLTPVAVSQTRRRFDLFQLQGRIEEADAEALPFENESYDFAYSWGVLHHTPRTQKAIDEIYRVLKPGGEIGLMLYHRDSFLFRYYVRYIEGFINMEKNFLSPLELASRYGDGERREGNPITWPVTKKEVRQVLLSRFQKIRIRCLGTELVDFFDQIFPALGRNMPEWMMRACIERWGWSLWITAEKPI